MEIEDIDNETLYAYAIEYCKRWSKKLTDDLLKIFYNEYMRRYKIKSCGNTKSNTNKKSNTKSITNEENNHNPLLSKKTTNQEVNKENATNTENIFI